MENPVESVADVSVPRTVDDVPAAAALIQKEIVSAGVELN